MKKISAFIILAALTTPVFAEDTDTKIDSKDVVENIDDSVSEESREVANDNSKDYYSSENRFPKGLQFGLGVSVTSGINGFVGYANKDFDSFWWKRLGVRFDFATTSPIKSTINSAIDSAMDGGMEIGDGMFIDNGQLSANHFAALVDFYPFGDTWFFGGIRLTGGYMFGKLDISADLTGDIDGIGAMEFELNDVLYRYNGDTINGTANANWKYSGPYLGTGFDLGLLWGIKIYMDAGVVFSNKSASINLNAPVTDQLPVWNGSAWEDVELDPTLISEFESDKDLALKDANDELEKYKIYPMIKLGFMYRF